ncbi:ankyrin-3-like isoform X1 [Paroedura picta]|uniref:ankyrin-3-like isoform X1 n=1 Tax=Paroedura picta TaxID=143630 RepID=UPI0040568423
MVHRRLLAILEELTDEDVRKFAFLVQGLDGLIPRGKLEGASRVQLAELLVRYCPGEELAVAARVLDAVPRRDLLKKFRLGRHEGAPRAEAGSPLQEQEPSVREKTGEATSRTAEGLAGTAPIQRQVSDKALMKVAKILGKNWRAIGIEYLGVAISHLEQIEEENPGNAVMRNFYMLKAWMRNEGKGATPAHLYDILTRDEVPLDQNDIEFLRSS